MKTAILTQIKVLVINDYTEENSIGIRAEAKILIPTEPGNYIVQEINSGGLWGIESDASEEYIEEIAEDQIEEVKRHLEVLNVNMVGNIRLFPKSKKNKETTKSFELLKQDALLSTSFEYTD